MAPIVGAMPDLAPLVRIAVLVPGIVAALIGLMSAFWSRSNELNGLAAAVRRLRRVHTWPVFRRQLRSVRPARVRPWLLSLAGLALLSVLGAAVATFGLAGDVGWWVYLLVTVVMAALLILAVGATTLLLGFLLAYRSLRRRRWFARAIALIGVVATIVDILSFVGVR